MIIRVVLLQGITKDHLLYLTLVIPCINPQWNPHRSLDTRTQDIQSRSLIISRQRRHISHKSTKVTHLTKMAVAGVTHCAHAVGSALRTPRSQLRRNHETVVGAHVFVDQSNRLLWLVHSHYRSHVPRFSFVFWRARTHAHHFYISTLYLMGYLK